MVDIWTITHHCIDQIRLDHEDSAVREGNQAFELLQSSLQHLCLLFAILERVESLQKALNTVRIEHVGDLIRQVTLLRANRALTVLAFEASCLGRVAAGRIACRTGNLGQVALVQMCVATAVLL